MLNTWTLIFALLGVYLEKGRTYRMSNALIRRHLDPVIFKQFLEDHGTSIRQLGNLVQTSERTLRRCIKQEYVTLNIAIDLCTYFDCSFDDIFGPDNSNYWRQARMNILRIVR